VLDLIAHDKAGERILEALLTQAEVRLHEEGISGDVYLFKNNTDSAGNSYGCHENYLVARQGEFARIADILIPFFVTRQIYCGAGKILHGPRGAQFCISQRAEHIWEGVSSATTRSRPIINTRDEPHADAERFRRLHVIVGDSNMSEFTTFLKVGITDVVVRMVEENTVMRDLSLENPIRAIREISHDMSCKRKVRLATGRELTAIDIQSEYFDRATRFVERRGADPMTERILREWGGALEALRVGEPERLVTKVDWVGKLDMIERYRAKHGIGLAHPRIALMDLAYHDVNRARGLYYLLERHGRMDRVVPEKQIQKAMREPPQTTRARLRGEFIRQAKQRRRDYTVDWVHLKLNDQAQRTVLCKDPFRSVDERVEQLIAHM
jgi:proteasome accessory factor A